MSSIGSGPSSSRHPIFAMNDDCGRRGEGAVRGDFTTRPELVGSFGMVSSTHWLASAVGMRMLELGGNAFDAAVATGFTLQIVEPHLNGPGGDVPIIFQRADADEPTVLCGQGVAPKAAAIDRFRELGLKLVPGTGLFAGGGAGVVRRLDVALARSWYTAAAHCSGAVDRLRPKWLSAVAGDCSDDRGDPRSLHRRLAEFGRGLVAERSSASAGRALLNAFDCRHLSAHSGGGRGTKRRSRGADRGSTKGVLPRLRCRGDRSLLSHV